jgi:hypothetical protein
MPVMPQHLSDSEFEHARDRFFQRSVRAAVEETYWSSAWRPAAEVRPVLAAALERRGIDPEAEAVQRGADVISRGRRPSVLRSGRRVRESG